MLIREKLMIIFFIGGVLFSLWQNGVIYFFLADNPFILTDDVLASSKNDILNSKLQMGELSNHSFVFPQIIFY